MSLTPRMTLIGLHNYRPGLFDLLHLPDGIDKDLFINSLLMKYGECPVIYTHWDFMRSAIGVWSNKWYDAFARMLLTMSDPYNPLWNYDRYEELNDEEHKNGSTIDTANTTTTNNLNENLRETTGIDTTGTEATEVTRSGSSTGTGSVTKTETETTSGEGSETITHGKTTTEEEKISAMNMSTYQPDRARTVAESGTTKTDTESETERETGSTEESETSETTQGTESGTKNTTGREDGLRTQETTKGGTVNTTDNRSGNSQDNRSFDHNAHMWGNIGVTTSQQMATEEVKLRREINLYDVLAEIFREELCLYIF